MRYDKNLFKVLPSIHLKLTYNRNKLWKFFCLKKISESYFSFLVKSYLFLFFVVNQFLNNPNNYRMILHYAVDYIQLSNFQLQTWRLKPNIETMNGFVRRDIAELTIKSLFLDLARQIQFCFTFLHIENSLPCTKSYLYLRYSLLKLLRIIPTLDHILSQDYPIILNSNSQKVCNYDQNLLLKSSYKHRSTPFFHQNISLWNGLKTF